VAAPPRNDGVSDRVGCLACDLAAGRLDLPGGLVHEVGGWRVEHCVGPLGVGTLVVKPRRHVVHVWDLTDAEADALGPLLRRSAQVVAQLVEPDQVYVCLWSHAGGRPAHIHWVVQPVTNGLMAQVGTHGPGLQLRMFERGEVPPRGRVEAFATLARERFAAGG